MFGTILHRMIFLELIKVFTLSLVGIMGILVLAGMVQQVTQQGMTPGQVLAIVPLLIPNMLPWTIPTTTLFATTVVYGRLAHDNEILAIKSAGINILKVVWPGILLGLVMSGVTLGLYYRFIPYTRHLLRTTAITKAREVLYTMLKRQGCIREPGNPWVLFVRDVQGDKLRDPIFRRFDPEDKTKTRYDVTAVAKEAVLDIDVVNRQLLVNMHRGVVLGDKGNNLSFVEKGYPVDLPADLANVRRTRPSDMTWQEILRRRRQLLLDQQGRDLDIVQTEGRLHDAKHKRTNVKHLENLKQKTHHLDLELNGLSTELQMRPALSFGCLFFVLVGCPVGIWFSRSDYLSAFITCFLPIIFIYYPLLLCSSNFARQGQVAPALAVWGADAVMALIAVFLFRRLMKN